MTPGAPAAEDVFGSPPREPTLEKGSDPVVRGRVDVDAL
jgi:hypothetical protein